ncbi:MAG TPA: hypothetical protein VEC10_04090 [Steroidobacteraceae bacterium]|nr:hypothetical protein [Steroidobacteraceae bacterium]
MARPRPADLMRCVGALPLMLLVTATVSGAAPQQPDEPDEQKDRQEQQERQEQKDRQEQKEQSDDENKASAPLSLTPSQQQAVGIRIEHPLVLSTAPAIEAYGTVLDPATLVTDLGRMESTQAAAASAEAEAARLQRLYRDDAQASLKASQAAQAQAVEAQAQSRAAAIGFALQWGPLASWSATERQTLLGSLGNGQRLLLRAEVPGRRLASGVDARALVEVDGVSVAARVLGPLARTDAQSQSAGWLLLLERAPPGLGPGARALVRLRPAASTHGLLVPATALVYAEEGAYVYRQLSAGDAFRYAPAAVKPLARVGNAWLVEGLARTDQVVVQGAGVLWSLQGVASFSAAEEEHD